MKKIFILLISIILTAIIVGIVIFAAIPSAIKNFEKDFSLDIPPNTKVVFEEDEVAFDGSSLFSVFQVNSDDVGIITDQMKQKGWSELPFNREIANALTKKINSLSQKGDEIININCKNGYYIVRQNSMLKKPAEDDFTSNLKIAVFDSDKRQIYYCKWTY